MIASYQLPNYWTWKVFLCVIEDDCTIQDVYDFYKLKHSLDFSGIETAVPCCLIDEHSMSAVICLKNWKKSNFNISLLVHEVMHLLIAISDVSGCEMNNHTTECWAYSMQSFIETILDVLDEKEKARCS